MNDWNDEQDDRTVVHMPPHQPTQRIPPVQPSEPSQHGQPGQPTQQIPPVHPVHPAQPVPPPEQPTQQIPRQQGLWESHPVRRGREGPRARVVVGALVFSVLVGVAIAFGIKLLHSGGPLHNPPTSAPPSNTATATPSGSGTATPSSTATTALAAPGPGGSNPFILAGAQDAGCAEIPDDGSSGQMAQNPCNGAATQQFNAQAVGDGSYYLTSVTTGNCVDVSGNSTDDGAQVISYQCHNGTNQQWKPQSITGSTEVALVNVNSGKCLAGTGGQLVQQTCQAYPDGDQAWLFSKNS